MVDRVAFSLPSVNGAAIYRAIFLRAVLLPMLGVDQNPIFVWPFSHTKIRPPAPFGTCFKGVRGKRCNTVLVHV